MSDILKSIVERAKSLNKNIVLTEGEDARVVKAAAEAAAEKIARITLLGNAEAIKKNNPDADLSGVTIVDPVTDERTAKYAEMLFELRPGFPNMRTRKRQKKPFSKTTLCTARLCLKRATWTAWFPALAILRQTPFVRDFRSSKPRPESTPFRAVS